LHTGEFDLDALATLDAELDPCGQTVTRDRGYLTVVKIGIAHVRDELVRH
jgi:hypothetical protein